MTLSKKTKIISAVEMLLVDDSFDLRVLPGNARSVVAHRAGPATATADLSLQSAEALEGIPESLHLRVPSTEQFNDAPIVYDESEAFEIRAQSFFRTSTSRQVGRCLSVARSLKEQTNGESEQSRQLRRSIPLTSGADHNQLPVSSSY